jgi:hypothetical protein
MGKAMAMGAALLIVTSWSGLAVAADDSGFESYAIYGADQFFKLNWAPAERRGRPIVAGYISNEFGFSARDVRLRVESLDPAGRVVAKTTGYVPGVMTPGVHIYFEVPVTARADGYRVTVLSFELLQKGKGIF